MSTLPRRGFFKRSGILLGFAWAPGGLLTVFDARACGEEGDVDLNAWVHVSNSENTITAKCPSAEMGQGLYTAIPLWIAEELDADWRTMRVEQAASEKAFLNPALMNTQGAGGARSAQGYWRIARLMGAQARAILIANAAREWQVPVTECATEPNNVVHAASGRKISYMQVAKLDNVVLDARPVTDKDLKPAVKWRLIGRDVQRLDVGLKAAGRAKYGMDVQIPGMLYASVLHPPTASCPYPLSDDGAAQGPLAVDDAAALKIEGVTRVIALPHAVAVVGTDYWATVKGRQALRVTWRQDPAATRYDSEGVKREWAALAADTTASGRAVGGSGSFEDALKSAAQTLTATYVTDHAHHACMEPFNATASMMHDDIEVWSPTQAQTAAQQAVAKVTGLAADKVRVHTTFLGGGFGAKTEQLANAEAAMLSQLMDKAVKVMWSRDDDVQHGAYRPLSAQFLQAAISGDGRITGWRHRVVADSVQARVGKGAWAREGIDSAVATGMTQPYAIANRQHEYLHRAGGVPVGYWNAVGSGYTIFAVESFVDELAAKLNQDPLQLRIELLKDTRARTLLERVRTLSQWDRKRESTALGLAYNHGGAGQCQAAQVVEISLDRAARAMGTIKVHNIWAVADAGRPMQPRHLRQQIETGIIWGLSCALRERVVIKAGVVQQSNFHDYPVPRIDEIPAIHIELLQGLEEPLSGAGQVGVAPVAPAIANALFRLTGSRVRSLPLLPERELQT